MSVYDIAGVATSVTRVPVVGEAGGVEPRARGIITPVNDAAVGLVHEKAIEVLFGVARTLVTGPGMALVFVNQPEMSAIRWTVPAEPLYRATLPLAPPGQ